MPRSLLPDLDAVPAPPTKVERAAVVGPAMATPAGWSARREATLTALVRRVLEGAPLVDQRVPQVVREVTRRLAGLAPHQQRDLGRALDLFGSRLAGLAATGRPVAFAEADATRQARWLDAWATSSVVPLRSAFQVFRRLALGTHYSDTDVAAAIGHAGPREVHTLHAEPLVLREARDLARVRAAPVGANQVGLFSAHVNGTCRMGTDRRTAATSPDGERFGARGTFVCDGSLLPTALGVNPQATIMALATVVSERVAARYGPTVQTRGGSA